MIIGRARKEHEKHLRIMKSQSAQRETEEEKMDWKTENERAATFKLWFVAFSDQDIQPLGQRALTCQHKGQKHMMEFKITHEDVLAIVEGDTFFKLALVKRMHDIWWEKDS